MHKRGPKKKLILINGEVKKAIQLAFLASICSKYKSSLTSKKKFSKVG